MASTQEAGRLGAGYIAFQSPNFRLHCLARLVYGIALSMQSVAVGWYVYSVTKSALALGLSGLASFAPAAFFALFTGHVADSYDRRLVVSIAFSVSALAAFGLLVIALLGVTNVNMIYACILLLGASRAFANPAAQALTPNLVPKEHFANAVTWYSSSWSTARIVGPAIGGLLFLAGSAAPFLGCFLLFATAALCMFMMGATTQSKAGRGPVTWETLSAGLKFIRSREVILGGISLDLVAVLFGGATALLPIVAQDILGTGAWGLGLLRASPAVGAIVMGALLAHLPIRTGAGKKMLFAVGCYGLAIIGFGLSGNLVLSMLMLSLVGASDQISVVVRHTMVQSETPDEMRGRVAAVNAIFISGSSDLGEFESGVTAAWWGTVPAIIVGGAATMGFAMLWAVIFPQLRDRQKLVEG
jgi:MFS family permease